MIKIAIYWVDGEYIYRKALENEIDTGASIAEVPKDLLDMWDSIKESRALMQRQLCRMDNDWHEVQERNEKL